MNIGISTEVRTENRNYDRVLDLVKAGFKYIEINNNITRVRFKDINSLVELRKKKKLTYSFHSLVKNLFCPDKIISDAEYNFIKGELRLAALTGAQRLIFHIAKKDQLDTEERKKLLSLLKIAKSYKIKLCLENNSSNGAFAGDYLINVLNEYDDLFLCLDTGHLNIANNNGQIKNIDSFLDQLKNKIIHLHISYNNGFKDQHLSLNKRGSDYVKRILDYLNHKNISAIIETKNFKLAIKTQVILKNLY